MKIDLADGWICKVRNAHEDIEPLCMKWQFTVSKNTSREESQQQQKHISTSNQAISMQASG